MKFTELINSNFSRKAEIVIVTIAALVYIGTFQSDQGKVIDPDIIRLAIYGVAWIGTLGIFVQASVDWKNAGPNATCDITCLDEFPSAKPGESELEEPQIDRSQN